MKAEYIDHMGDDLRVVNSARVSFDKVSTELTDRDVKLISYLARHKHWTPFSHPTVTFRITAPIFVARQAFKHKVGFTENEVSRRYVDDAPSFYMPDIWRGKPVSAKQGSSEVSVEFFLDSLLPISAGVQMLYDRATQVYNDLLASGVCPEQARMVLPQGMYTSWYWTASLAAWARFYALRSDSHAQVEIQELAGMITDKMNQLFPFSWKALTTFE